MSKRSEGDTVRCKRTLKVAGRLFRYRQWDSWMRRLFIVVLMCGACALAFAQTTPPLWQPGTITAVAPHSYRPGEQTSNTVQYDVSIEVGNTVYVVLYEPPVGSNTVEYRVGFNLLVLLGTDVLTFNQPGQLSGKAKEVPILSKEVLPAQDGLDLDRLPGQYFSLKLQHLSETLNLSEEQRNKIKPIVEQEGAEMGQFWANPVLSFDDKVKGWEKVVRSSDKKLKPFLSTDQVRKFQEMRKEQKKKLEQIKVEQKQKQTR